MSTIGNTLSRTRLIGARKIVHPYFCDTRGDLISQTPPQLSHKPVDLMVGIPLIDGEFGGQLDRVKSRVAAVSFPPRT